MSTPTWPSSLPGLNVEGYSEEPEEGVLRTSVDAGPDFTRRRVTAVPTRIQDTLYLTGTQVATLRAFHRDTLAMGSRVFAWDHPRTGDAVTIRFLRAPSIVAEAGGTDGNHDFWAMQISIEVMP